MENQVQTIVCPNCGANATNHQNCEYCGSLLVRFADKNIEIDESRYGHSAFRFSGLEEALTKNLEEQANTYGRNHIHTFIKSRALNLELEVTNPKSQAEATYYQWGDALFRVNPSQISTSKEQSLVICLGFYEITNKIWANPYGQHPGVAEELNSYNQDALARFESLDIYDLFSSHTDILLDNSTGMSVGNVKRFYLDFGKDVQGAAAIITQYLLGCFAMPNVQSMRLTYELSSITEEDYLAQVREDTKRGRKYFWVFLISGIVFIITGVLLLISYAGEGEVEPLLAGVGGIAMGGLMIYLAAKKIKRQPIVMEDEKLTRTKETVQTKDQRNLAMALALIISLALITIVLFVFNL